MGNQNQRDNKNFKKHLRELLTALVRRHFANPSKREQCLFISVSALAVISFILNVISAIAGRDGWAVARSLTLGALTLVLTVLLTLSDTHYIWRRRSCLQIAYSALMLIAAALGLGNPPAGLLVLGILSLIAAIALYGVLIFDQFVKNDSPVKYWLVYCGAAYNLLLALVMMIVGVVNAGVIGVLAVVFGGLSSVATLLLLLYLFDDFSFARYMYNAIIDAGADECPAGTDSLPDERDDAPSADGDTATPGVAASPVVDGAYDPYDDISEDERYLPYVGRDDAPDDAPHGDSSNEEKHAPYDGDRCRKSGNIEETPREGEAESSGLSGLEPGDIQDAGGKPYADGEPLLPGADEGCARDGAFSPEADDDDNAGDGEAGGYEAGHECGEDACFIGVSGGVTDGALEDNDNEHDNPVFGGDSAADEKSPEMSHAPEALGAGEISPTLLKYARFAAAHNKPDATLQVTGMSGDLFDVWVDGDTICFLNDLSQAGGGRGVRSAAIAFGDVSSLSRDCLEGSVECVVLSYLKEGQTREIRFTKESFPNFKRVMELAGGE